MLALATTAGAQPRDGSHDFDFDLGDWRTEIHRTPEPFDSSVLTYMLKGVVRVRALWGGRAQMEQIEADGPAGHWEGMNLFLYNPAAGQWSQTFANSRQGQLQPPMIGSFNRGMGELYAQDTFKGRSIIVRTTWSNIFRDSHHYQEAYSDDGGQTWHVSFEAQLQRIACSSGEGRPSVDAAASNDAFACR